MLCIRRVVGQSMSPTLKEGQLVFAIKSKKYHIGQIVIANQNSREVIKRIAEINGKEARLLGDNMAYSSDSRKYGPVKTQDIIARVIFRV